MGKHKHEVRTIFYDIKPTVVRNQTESYAFAEHESPKRTEVAKWKKALSIAANLSGWSLEDMANGYESKLIDIISKEIFEKLCSGQLHVGEKLVGLDTRVQKMNLSRFVGSNKVHMIGICGIGGIGKTTLAKAIYNLMCIHFEECSFFENVQGAIERDGLPQVLMQLIADIMKARSITISNVGQGIKAMKQMVASKRILLVLDDVNHSTQLEALAGSHNWFCPGSLIIFTSRDKWLLRSHKVDEIYDMGYLDDHEALELFSMHAFGKKDPAEDFEETSEQIVHSLQGHPLGLKVLGSSLYCKTMDVWKSNLDKLRIPPIAKIIQVLRLSFDTLDIVQRRVLLDIACYLIGKRKDFAVRVLDSCNFFGEASIDVLVDKSLVTITKGMRLQMHDMIKRMAFTIICEESIFLGKRSRLCIESEVCDVLNKNEVTKAIEVLILSQVKYGQNVHIDVETFARMTKLRILQICRLEQENFSGSVELLSNELRLLYWHGFPFKFLPLNFYPENIVSIDLSYSHIENLRRTPKVFKNLKKMNLSHCHNLANTPDFTEITNLEKLILEDCVHLVELHPSIAMLKRLVVLNLRNCTSLRGFPGKVEMDSLEVLILSRCLKVEKLPEALGMVKTLVELHVDQTPIKKLPSFVSSLSNLQVLSTSELGGIRSTWWTSILRPSFLLKNLQHRPSSVLPSLAGLCYLRDLDVSRCNISDVSTDIIGGLSRLERLNMSWNNFTSLPESLGQLSRLIELIVVGCRRLEVLPPLADLHSLRFLDVRHCNISEVNFNSIGDLSRLDCLDLSGNNFTSFCASSTAFPRIKILIFSGFKKLKQMQKFRTTAVKFRAIDCASLREFVLRSQGNGLFNRWELVFHGSRIPKWHTTWSKKNHVKVELPSGWCYNKFRGYATCAILITKKPYRGISIVVPCEVRNFDGALIVLSFIHMSNCCTANETIGSNVIWSSRLMPDPNWMKAKNFVTFSFHVFPIFEEYFEMKKCGARVFCDEDIEDERGSSMIQGLPPLTQDGAIFNPNCGGVLEVIEDDDPPEDEPPFKKNRIM